MVKALISEAVIFTSMQFKTQNYVLYRATANAAIDERSFPTVRLVQNDTFAPGATILGPNVVWSIDLVRNTRNHDPKSENKERINFLHKDAHIHQHSPGPVIRQTEGQRALEKSVDAGTADIRHIAKCAP